jgi:hypothetical protein
MAMDDATDGREPDPCSGKLAREMESLKGSEQPVGLGHLKTGPVVAHELGGLPVRLDQAEVDLRHRETPPRRLLQLPARAPLPAVAVHHSRGGRFRLV